MYIGEVSKKSGLSIKAIRLYEVKGLIRTPARSGRYRIYNHSDVEILKLIVEAKALGVTLARLKNVIVYNEEGADWQRIKHFLIDIKAELIKQREDINQRIKHLDACLQAI
jgi:DNA-binding transcriptional MerR regulator